MSPRVPSRMARLVAAGVAIAGCSGGERRDAVVVSVAAPVAARTSGRSDKPVVTAPTAADSRSAAAVPVAALAHQPGDRTFEGARGDATVLACAGGSGWWRVRGDVQNPTELDAEYRVFVVLLQPDGTTAAVAEADVDRVAAGGAAAFSLDVPTEATSAECVLRVERRPTG